MKKIVTSLLVLFTLFSCNKDDSPQDNNPNLLSPLVNINLNLNLPEYNTLKFPGNSVIISSQGIKGVVVYNVNNSLYTAFELSDPNHVPNNCSTMTIVAPIATCPCTSDTNKYNIITGEHESNQNMYPMQQYRASRTGDIVQVTN